jgi:hypothetical protein
MNNNSNNNTFIYNEGIADLFYILTKAFVGYHDI